MGTKRWVVAVLVAATLLAGGACGGGGDDGGDGATKGKAGDDGAAAPTTTAVDPATEVPAFLSDYERVCTTQVGFGGASAYEAAPGVHPVVLFEDYRGEGFVQSSRSLPAGWAVQEDTDFKNTSDLAKAELVACSDRVKETPTGKQCTFKGDEDAKGDDAKPVDLELVDATYELKVYEARTAKLLSTSTLEATSTECPFIATFKKGDSTFVDQPSDDDYTAALKAAVTGTPGA
jgi:hypothetical protein